ncbi:MAG: hypothetical protein LBB86_03345 [Oscillospiraceae bacterium]|jgi:hypothetical protein|nr:hypothetical protein [Oscillospiraceae bacterium]
MSGKQRDYRIDILKGALVCAMITCHVLQFYGDTQLFPSANTWMLWINITAFSGFVFAYGWSVSIAYLDKPYSTAAPRIALSCLRSYAAFAVSGVAFRVVYEGKPFAQNTVRRILLLQDIPGWSEFLAAFFAYALVTLILFIPMKKLRSSTAASILAAAACIAVCLAPIRDINIPYINLLIGGGTSTLFPIVQYAPYFIAGLLMPSITRLKQAVILVAVSVAASAAGGLLWSIKGEPSRFPPGMGWILTPAAVIAALVLAAAPLAATLRCERWSRWNPVRALCSLGRDSLYYLVMSNLAIFALAASNIAPWLKSKTWFLWATPIQSPLGALYWALALIAVIRVTAAFAKRR